MVKAAEFGEYPDPPRRSPLHPERHLRLQAEAGFTHSLSPARNCTLGCTHCHVPTMRIYGGLKPADWQHWGGSTTFKSNAPELLGKSLRAEQIIYCSPLVDPLCPANAGGLSA